MDPGIVAQAGHVAGQAPPQPFDVVVRGYDRHQVDEHIRQLETQARRLRERERPSYARPGSQIEQLLRLAEEQVTKIVQESRSAADELQAAAEVDAAELRAAAEKEPTAATAKTPRKRQARKTPKPRGPARSSRRAMRQAWGRRGGSLTARPLSRRRAGRRPCATGARSARRVLRRG